MKKILFGFVILCLFVGGYLLLNREVADKYVIGVINFSPSAHFALQGFKTKMAELGYVEGENTKYVYSGPIRDKAKLQEEGKRLLRLEVDLFFAMSTPAALVAKEITTGTSIPVLFAPVSSPVKAGIVKSLVAHEKNITGVTFGPQEPRRLEMLIKLKPEIRRVYVPYNPNDKSPVLAIKRLQPVADKLGLKLILDEISGPDELTQRIQSFRTDIDAIFIPTDSYLVSQTHQFISLSLRENIPLTCPHREGVVEGALFSYGFSIREIGAQAAHLADQIFKGVSPGELPVELGEFILTVNTRTADSIGLEIPETVFRQALLVK